MSNRTEELKIRVSPEDKGADKTQNGGRRNSDYERLCPQDGAGRNLYPAGPEGCAPAYCHAPAMLR